MHGSREEFGSKFYWVSIGLNKPIGDVFHGSSKHFTYLHQPDPCQLLNAFQTFTVFNRRLWTLLKSWP